MPQIKRIIVSEEETKNANIQDILLDKNKFDKNRAYLLGNET